MANGALECGFGVFEVGGHNARTEFLRLGHVMAPGTALTRNGRRHVVHVDFGSEMDNELAQTPGFGSQLRGERVAHMAIITVHFRVTALFPACVDGFHLVATRAEAGS